MNIVIVGAGKVGFNLAKTLSIAHNVIVVDKNIKALHRIQENLDILTLQGDSKDIGVYDSLIDKNIDLFIAVTNLDDVNLVSVLIADSALNIKRKFVRLQEHFYDEKAIKNKLGIEKIIFPRRLASASIVSLLDYPKANNVKSFKYTPHKLISVRADKDIEPLTIQNDQLKIVGIERKNNFFIPQENNIEILPNDLVYFFGIDTDIKQICNKIEKENLKEINKCVVFGGEDLGISISKALLDVDKNVKLIESDIEQCKKADKILKGRASIINLKYSTNMIFEEEGLENADIFIAASSNDEYNIIKCLEAKQKGIHKVVAINNELDYYNLMHSLGIIVTRGPKISAYNTIMEYISSTGVVIQKSYCGAKANVFMRKIFKTSKLVNKTIKPPKNIKNTLIFCIKNNSIELLDNTIKLEEEDLIVSFSLSKDEHKIQKWIYGL